MRAARGTGNGRKGDILTFLEKYTLQERVLVAKHETLVGGMAMSGLQVLQVLLVDADSFL